MGDPGVAKSQLLGYIDRLAPRSKLLLPFCCRQGFYIFKMCPTAATGNSVRLKIIYYP